MNIPSFEDLRDICRPCGRPKKNGEPCKNKLYGRFALACDLHATEEEHQLSKLLYACWNTAHSEGYHSGYEAAEQHIQWETERAARAANEPPEIFRLKDANGHYLVQVDVGTTVLTYRWTRNDEPALGAVVHVPTAYWESGHSKEGTVVALGSSYQGALVSI